MRPSSAGSSRISKRLLPLSARGRDLDREPAHRHGCAGCGGRREVRGRKRTGHSLGRELRLQRSRCLGACVRRGAGRYRGVGRDRRMIVGVGAGAALPLPLPFAAAAAVSVLLARRWPGRTRQWHGRPGLPALRWPPDRSVVALAFAADAVPVLVCTAEGAWPRALAVPGTVASRTERELWSRCRWRRRAEPAAACPTLWRRAAGSVWSALRRRRWSWPRLRVSLRRSSTASARCAGGRASLGIGDGWPLRPWRRCRRPLRSQAPRWRWAGSRRRPGSRSDPSRLTSRYRRLWRSCRYRTCRSTCRRSDFAVLEPVGGFASDVASELLPDLSAELVLEPGSRCDVGSDCGALLLLVESEAEGGVPVLVR